MSIRNSWYLKLADMCLGAKGVPDHNQYMFILQILGKECLHHWESFPLAAPHNNEKEQPEHICDE